MINISNIDIDSEKCTRCPTCNKPSWYIMQCECGHYVCRYCSAKEEEEDSDLIEIICPKCGNSVLYV